MGMTNQEAIETIEANYPSERYSMLREALNMSIALLREQEAVEPIPPTDESDLWKCGNCKRQLFRCTHQKYCEMCGRKVKWEWTERRL